MPEKDNELIQRFGHGAAAVTVNSDCVEVILYGGNKELGGSFIANAVVLRFGKYHIFYTCFLYFNIYVGPTDAFATDKLM